MDRLSILFIEILENRTADEAGDVRSLSILFIEIQADTPSCDLREGDFQFSLLRFFAENAQVRLGLEPFNSLY